MQTWPPVPSLAMTRLGTVARHVVEVGGVRLRCAAGPHGEVAGAGGVGDGDVEGHGAGVGGDAGDAADLELEHAAGGAASGGAPPIPTPLRVSRMRVGLAIGV